MKSIRKFHFTVIIGLALIPLSVAAVNAQPGTRRSSEATRRAIANDTFRELMKIERETHALPTLVSEKERAMAVKQLREDFRAIQDVNNKMMSAAWATESIDYRRTSDMLRDINEKAVRLRNRLSLPEAKKTKRNSLTASGLKEFKSALLIMDRSLMSFVNNPIFRERNVMEVNLAAQATEDLEDVISYSANLRKIAGNLKNVSLKQ